MQQLKVLQSLWAMERREPDGFERTLEENLHIIAAASFDGVSYFLGDRDQTQTFKKLVNGTGLAIEACGLPASDDDLRRQIALAGELNPLHYNVQPDVRLRGLAEGAHLMERWIRISESAGFPVYFETHRNRLTTDLFYTLDLMDAVPDIPLLADLSHFLVGREFAWPVSAENHRLIERILDSSWAFHGRVASREQVQIEISFPHHKMWVNLFASWWRYGFRSWRRRAQSDAVLSFTCELGPRPYAITNRAGQDSTDRWAEALLMRGLVTDIWADSGENGTISSTARSKF
ncbi:sugar phosphate isomerase/epimerase [Mesorhizobium sp.]|uniref:sugar phosphate isomerase/epimerase family protein n=1 Tax=Mesorhizobium sp. TaxID=1871066 RepID=UPI000FE90689|nr:sugar phosphate isomerase/epimerase [Mesorhizobium sp.]RWO77410.1 MAG: sugar phosphate isomerase/epimerase [Mesorhizobium sp.]RWQ13272.1 MAG: sugar phosphate isomerase/epimerase [Mesorhizobium sp.]